MTDQPMRRWQDIDPADAKEINLRQRKDITAPLNEKGERCPWPWWPQLVNGIVRHPQKCPYCGARIITGEEHTDYAFVPSGAYRGPENRTPGDW